MNNKFKNAPISEVIIGVTFKSSIFANDNYIFDFISSLKKDFPVIQFLGPIADEELINYRISNNINPNITGPGLYRLQDINKNWLIQIQNNKLYLNWIRPDNFDVGNYPGFSKIFERFHDLLTQIEKNSDLKLLENVKYFELIYQDRVYWEDYIKDLSEVNNLINLNPPCVFNDCNKIEPNNISSTFSYLSPDIGGHIILQINTWTNLDKKQILVLECSIKGNTIDNITNWFQKSHKIQTSTFENIFNQQILNKWKA